MRARRAGLIKLIGFSEAEDRVDKLRAVVRSEYCSESLESG